MKHYNAIFFRMILVVIGMAMAGFLFQKGLIFTSLFVVLVALLLLLELYAFVKNTFLFYDRTIHAILNNDFSADFSKHKSFENYQQLFKLYEHLKVKQNDQVSKDLVYRSILNNIESGVLILQKESDDWNVFLINDYFSKHFKAPKVSKWHYLKNHLPALCQIIEERDFEEIKTALQIRVDQQESETFILQTSATTTFNQEYYIVLLDSIQKVVEKKEKEAWINLMKVISHELMNSITPIRSLTQNLSDLMQQESLSKEDLDDIKDSVSTMIYRSDHLQHFVESYRKLAMLPTPKKERTELCLLISNVLQIMQPLFKKEQIMVENTITSHRWLSVDSLQMEQVLINLLTNSMFALEGKKEKHIRLASEVKDNRVFISISDSGNGIEKEIEDKIFLPFFTTRKEGAGIGLTLSKNIVEAHGGYLNYQTEDSRTKFVIALMG